MADMSYPHRTLGCKRHRICLCVPLERDTELHGDLECTVGVFLIEEVLRVWISPKMQNFIVKIDRHEALSEAGT